MRTKSLVMATLTILGAGSVYAADVEVKADTSSSPKVEAEVKREGEPRREYRQEVRVESSVRPANKASSIIGMEVRNRSDEKLGEVKDVVVDLPSGRISYVALKVGGFLGLGEKLIAIPHGALTPSDKSNVLILDATRGEIVDAPGFAATNWPDHRHPDFNQSPYWHPKASGSAPSSETGRGKLYTDADRKDKEVKVDASANSSAQHRTTGRIKSIDDVSHTITVETVDGRTETFINRETRASANDFKTGQRVVVNYHNDSGRMVIDNLARQ